MSEHTIELGDMMSIDESGNVKPLSLSQLQDKDIAAVYQRDKTYNKCVALKELGVVYYAGDPKSPPRQMGKSTEECVEEAIFNYGLPSNYKPDIVICKLIDKYKSSRGGVAQEAVSSLLSAFHNITLVVSSIQNSISNKLGSNLTDDELSAQMEKFERINKLAIVVPNMIESLNKALNTLNLEQEQNKTRGGKKTTTSMNVKDHVANMEKLKPKSNG